jgi:hypothetical protein
MSITAPLTAVLPRGKWRPIVTTCNMSVWRFIVSHLIANRPVVVTDAQQEWNAPRRWTPEFFKQEFGSFQVKLEDERFGDSTSMTVARYIDEFSRFEDDGMFVPRHDVPYLRYSGTENSEFNTRLFVAVENDWTRPYFLPAHLYADPQVLCNWMPNQQQPGGWGLFICPKGGCTSLHCDGDRSESLLAQIYGVKLCLLFPPGDRDRLRLSARLAGDGRAENWSERFGPCVPYMVLLRPGDTLFIPHLWYHEVHALTASISMTFNFIHGLQAIAWLAWRLRGGNRSNRFI